MDMTGGFGVAKHMTQLDRLATVRSGLVLARKDAKEISPFCYPLINLKSIQPEGALDREALDVFHATEKLDSVYLTQTQDILIRLSSPYTAILIDEATAGMVTSSNFVVIRPDTSRLYPAYLFWLLSTVDMKKRIYANTTRSMLEAVRPSFFSQLEVAIPNMPKQTQMGQLYLLARREAVLLRKLADARQQLCDIILKQQYKDILN